jgi:hypothetical protein
LAHAPVTQTTADVVGLKVEDVADVLERDRGAGERPHDPPLCVTEEAPAPSVLDESVLLVAVECLLEERDEKPYLTALRQWRRDAI